MIGYKDTPGRGELGWLLENTVWINRAHPAYEKAIAGGHEQYHVVLTVAWVLLGHLDDQHSALLFIYALLPFPLPYAFAAMPLAAGLLLIGTTII